MARDEHTPKSEAVMVRVSPDVFAALQLAQPFVGRRSMQDLLGSVIDDFLAGLREGEPGFELAVQGLREAQAREVGVLSRRTVDRRTGQRKRSV